eukprot:409043_1
MNCIYYIKLLMTLTACHNYILLNVTKNKMFPNKTVISSLLIASVVCIFIVFYLVDHDINSFQNEYEFLTDSTHRHILSENSPSPTQQHTSSQHQDKSDKQHNPNHIAQVKVTSDKTAEEFSKTTPHTKPNWYSFKDNQIVFAICCPANSDIIQHSSDDFIVLLHDAAIQSLQKATASVPLSTSKSKAHEHIPNTRTSQTTNAYKTGSKLHTVHTTTTQTTYTTSLGVNRLSTKFSTDDIHVTFQHGNTFHIGTSPLMMIFTLDGDKQFIKNFIRQLVLKSNRLETGITTTIESKYSHDNNYKGSLLVRWLWPRYEIPNFSLDRNHVNMLMKESNTAKNMKTNIDSKLNENELLLKREKRNTQLLENQMKNLDNVVQFAGQSVYPRLHDSHTMIQDSINHLRSKSIYIQHAMEELQQKQASIESMIGNIKNQVDVDRSSLQLNEQIVAQLKHELLLLKQRRVEIIGELQNMIERFKATVHVVILYQFYLEEKRKQSFLKDMQNTTKKFDKFDNSTWKCSNYVSHFMCHERAILCQSDEDIFDYNDASITADIHFKHPAVFKYDYEILVLANKECNSEIIDNDVEIKAATVHKCSFSDKNCILQSKRPYSKFGGEELKDICIYIRCNVTDTFDIEAIINVKVGSKINVFDRKKENPINSKHKKSALKIRNSDIIIDEPITKDASLNKGEMTTLDNSDDSLDDTIEEIEEAKAKQEKEQRSSSENVQHMIAIGAAVVCTIAVLIMSIFFIPKM